MVTTREGPDGRAELGRRGEDLAAAYLAERGWVLLDRNWRCRGGELDVVATDGDRLVVGEVKTRSGTGYGLPAEAVVPSKAARIRRLAHTWLTEHHVRFCEVRFDVLAVLLVPGESPRIEHYEGAF
jgi:putative endonuclease